MDRKAKLKELDRGMLKVWEAGVLEKDMGPAYLKVKHRVQVYRELGVVSGRAIDWVKFEEMIPPALRSRKHVAHVPVPTPSQVAWNNKDSDTDTPADPSPGDSGVIPEGNIDAVQDIAPEEMGALKEVVAWWRSHQGTGVHRTGEKQVVTLRLEAGLIEALRDAAEREGLSQEELVARAVDAYLGDGE